MCQIALPTSGERRRGWTPDRETSLNVYHTSSLAARLLLSTFSASAVGKLMLSLISCRSGIFRRRELRSINNQIMPQILECKIGQQNFQKKGNLRRLRADNSRSFAPFVVKSSQVSTLHTNTKYSEDFFLATWGKVKSSQVNTLHTNTK